VTEQASAAPQVLPRFPELDTQPFWDFTRAHELRYQQCRDCATIVFYPRYHCTHCTGFDLEWKLSAGLGRIYTYSVIRRSRHPAFAALVPYVIAWVDVDEGFRLMTHIVGADPDDPASGLAIDAPVEVEWLDRETLALPAFRLRA
jgi:uncharacterized OB-fold protein